MPVSGNEDDDVSLVLDESLPNSGHQISRGSTSADDLKALTNDKRLDSSNYAERLKDILGVDDDGEAEGHGPGNMGSIGREDEDDEDEDEDFLYTGIDAPQPIGYDAQLADVLDEPQTLSQQNHSMNPFPTSEKADDSISGESLDYNRYQVRYCMGMPSEPDSFLAFRMRFYPRGTH